MVENFASSDHILVEGIHFLPLVFVDFSLMTIIIILIALQIEELEGQKRLRTEMIQAEDNYAQMRKEYEMLRIEFEQAMAANDQNGKIHFLSTLSA